MFSKPHVVSALRAKQQDFADFQLEASEELDRFREALEFACSQGREDLLQLLEDIPRPGALPTVERVAGRSIVLPFAPRWENHTEARAWAMDTLRNVPTLAVDGSQITPSGDFSVPVGAVQVGWFENAHDPAGHYEKNIEFEIISPQELMDVGDEDSSFPVPKVNLRRFERECDVLLDYMQAMADHNPKPVCFFDGSLVISFAAQMRPELRDHYIRAVRALLITSETTRVPLVGYIDTSRSKDLVSMLGCLKGFTTRPHISDSALLRGQMRWGDRTEAFVCARNDSLFERNDDQDYYERGHFLYLKTTAENAPSRLDLPAWLLEDGLLDQVVDVVRAECVVGTGYPYAIETADAVAVITAADRERFYRTLQEFIDSLGLDLRYARKAYSKRGRR
jgi:hypothetical protein